MSLQREHSEILNLHSPRQPRHGQNKHRAINLNHRRMILGHPSGSYKGALLDGACPPAQTPEEQKSRSVKPRVRIMPVYNGGIHSTLFCTLDSQPHLAAQTEHGKELLSAVRA